MPIITLETARVQALFHYTTKVTGKYAAQPFRENLFSGIGDSHEVYDITDSQPHDLLYYAFEIIENHSSAGLIGIYADSSIGCSLAFILLNTNTPSIRDNRNRLATKLSINPDKLYLVTYSFPKLGLLLPGTENTLYDAFDLTQIELKNTISDQGIEGLLTFPLRMTLPQAGAVGEDKWEAENLFIEQFSGTSRITRNRFLSITPQNNSIKSLSITDTASDLNVINNINSSLADARVLIEEKYIPIQLHPQTTPISCAAASCQMIYEYVYRKAIDQNDIATGMKVSEAKMGCTPTDQLLEYSRLFKGDFEAILDPSPNISTLSSAIDSFTPVKCAIAGHARVAYGLRHQTILDPLTGKIQNQEVGALVADPYPVGTGSLFWENVIMTNWVDFIILKRSV